MAPLVALLPWAEELIASVFKVDFGLNGARPGCIVAPAEAAASVSSPDVLTTDPSAFADALIFPVAALHPSTRFHQTPLAYLLGCFARLEEVSAVSLACGWHE